MRPGLPRGTAAGPKARRPCFACGLAADERRLGVRLGGLQSEPPQRALAGVVAIAHGAADRGVGLDGRGAGLARAAELAARALARADVDQVELELRGGRAVLSDD